MDGTIKAKEINVTLASVDNININGTLAANNITYTANGNTADFVFDENYKLVITSYSIHYTKLYE